MKKQFFYFFLFFILAGCTDQTLVEEDVTTRAFYTPWLSGELNPTVGKEYEYTVWGIEGSYTTTWSTPIYSTVISRSNQKIKLKFSNTAKALLSANFSGSSGNTYSTARLDIQPRGNEEPDPGLPPVALNITGPDIIQNNINEITYKSNCLDKSLEWTLSENDSFTIKTNGLITAGNVTLIRKGYGKGRIHLRLYVRDNPPGNQYADKYIEVLAPEIVTMERQVTVHRDNGIVMRILARITINYVTKEASADLELLNPEDIEGSYTLYSPAEGSFGIDNSIGFRCRLIIPDDVRYRGPSRGGTYISSLYIEPYN